VTRELSHVTRSVPSRVTPTASFLPGGGDGGGGGGGSGGGDGGTDTNTATPRGVSYPREAVVGPLGTPRARSRSRRPVRPACTVEARLGRLRA